MHKGIIAVPLLGIGMLACILVQYHLNSLTQQDLEMALATEPTASLSQTSDDKVKLISYRPNPGQPDDSDQTILSNEISLNQDTIRSLIKNAALDTLEKTHSSKTKETPTLTNTVDRPNLKTQNGKVQSKNFPFDNTPFNSVYKQPSQLQNSFSPKLATPFTLPADFRVFVKDYKMVNHALPGYDERVLPTINHYEGDDGGYMALYTHQKEGAIYSVSETIYVMGQIRLKGIYTKRIFNPIGYGEVSTTTPKILAIAEKYFPDYKGKLWLGGDTGGWFGIQP